MVRKVAGKARARQCFEALDVDRIVMDIRYHLLRALRAKSSKGNGGVIAAMVIVGWLMAGCATTVEEAAASLDPMEAVQWMNRTPGVQLIDVRTPSEYAQGHLIGSKLVPLQ